MKIYFNLFVSFVIIVFILGGCASETTAPTDPIVPQGTIKPMPDNFMADSISVDPAKSSLFYVYLPPEYDEGRAEAYPVVYMLNGFGGDENYFVALFSAKDAADWLLSEGKIEPMVLVFPSGYNNFGGSFYTNSPHPHVGNSEDHILRIIAEVEDSLHVMKTPAGKGIGGHSMGGYGAVSIALNHGDIFGSVAALAAPLSFWGRKTFDPADTIYSGIEIVIDSVLAETGYDSVLIETGGVGDIVRYKELMVPLPPARGIPPLDIPPRVTPMMFGMAAAFSPTDPTNPLVTSLIYGIDLPIGIDGKIDMPTWERWMKYDPVSRLSGIHDAEDQHTNLETVKIWLDAGADDDLGLNGAHQVFSIELQKVGIVPDYDVIYDPIPNVEGEPIPADHTAYTYERIKEMLIWFSEKFNE